MFKFIKRIFLKGVNDEICKNCVFYFDGECMDDTSDTCPYLDLEKLK